MYIFQPDRYLLRNQVASMAQYMRGLTLDIGAGERNRYGDLFDTSEYVTMDITEGPNVSIVGSIEDIPSPENSFDSIVCTQVLEHVPHPQKAVEEMFRVLKAGGFALITAPQFNELHEEPHDYFRYTPFGLESLFSEAGFTVVEKKQRGGYFSLRAQSAIRYALDRFHLHKRPILGWVFSKWFALYGRFMLWLDSVDASAANRKHAIGWLYVVRKSE
jgi:SAM-dependent methyltransferase